MIPSLLYTGETFLSYMVGPSLEKVLKEKVEPLVEDAMHKFLGVTISEIGKDISDKIEKNPLISYPIDTSIPFKAAKKLFKKEFFTRLVRSHLGNVSAVARVSGLDRRSVHRAIRDLDIDVSKTRKDLLSTRYYQKEAVDQILRSTFDDYRQIIRPSKLEKMYRHADKLSGDIIKELPPVEMSWKQAEDFFERIYLQKALKENNGNISKTAKRIGLRFESLHRKLKRLAVA